MRNMQHRLRSEPSGAGPQRHAIFPLPVHDKMRAPKGRAASGSPARPERAPGALLRWAAPLGLLAGSALCQSAAAGAGDTFQPYLSYAYTHDDNLLRLPDGQRTTPDTADTYRRAEGGLMVDKRYSQQHVTAKFNLSRTTFDRFTRLDNNGKELQANWDWHLGSHLSGNLGASYAQALAPYTEFHGDERNLRSQRREFFDAAWRMHPSWSARGGFARYRLGYELATQKFGDRSEDATELGVDYRPAGGSSAGLLARHVRGGFPTPQQIGPLVVDNSYRQNELKGKLDWRISGKSRLQLLGGWVQRRHDFFPSRDASGPSVRLLADWLPSGKLGLNLTAWRDINATDDLTASYTVNKGASLAANWDLVAKVRVEGLIKLEQRDFSDATAFAAVPPSGRVDRSRYGALTVSYAALRNLQIGASLYRDDLNSNAARGDFSAKGMSLNLRSVF
jgi:exopolysaccharide biosynthesis operon protein EpsL